MCTNDVQAHHWGRFHNMTFLRFDKTPTHLHTNAAAMKFITFLWVILSFIKVSGNVLKNHSWLLALDTVAFQGTTTLEMMGPNKGFRRELNARGLLSRRKAMINCIGTFQSAVHDLDSPYLRDNIFALRVPNSLATTWSLDEIGFDELIETNFVKSQKALVRRSPRGKKSHSEKR